MDFLILRQCKYHCIGCNFTASSEEVTHHESCDHKHHLELIVIFMFNSDLQTLKTSNRLQEFSSDLRYRMQQLEMRHRSVTALEQGREREAVIVARLEEMEAAVRDIRSSYTFADPMASHLELANHGSSIAEQNVEVSTNTITIHRYEEERQRAMTYSHYVINSSPFFTSNGYKMCSRIYLNGHGIGTERCMTVFFVIMRGEDDAFLP
ncbi:hypothetical protein CHS0354_029404 [Potamilus streckersoni]|uniref:TRAF1-6 MATH domain-containing protein n=1 Tax=Potamilus streckersoni TaxID=2493646 RepID=A0AAE0STV5_9BIVA|nr:hypothetical protein CHS0354_029404 [Potamilus streckersoni]